MDQPNSKPTPRGTEKILRLVPPRKKINILAWPLIFVLIAVALLTALLLNVAALAAYR